jgi:hypothetical protein
MRALVKLSIVACAVAALLLPASAAQAAEHLGLHSMDCRGITAHGEGLKANAKLHLKLVDRDNNHPLLERDVMTSADGMFKARLTVRLDQVLSIRMFVTDAGGGEVGYADHTMEKGSPMCDLPFTGPGQGTGLLLGIALACLAAGGTALKVAGRGRRVA